MLRNFKLFTNINRKARNFSKSFPFRIPLSAGVKCTTLYSSQMYEASPISRWGRCKMFFFSYENFLSIKLTRSFRSFVPKKMKPKHNKNDKWCVMWNIYEKLFHITSRWKCSFVTYSSTQISIQSQMPQRCINLKVPQEGRHGTRLCSDFPSTWVRRTWKKKEKKDSNVIYL